MGSEAVDGGEEAIEEVEEEAIEELCCESVPGLSGEEVGGYQRGGCGCGSGGYGC